MRSLTRVSCHERKQIYNEITRDYVNIVHGKDVLEHEKSTYCSPSTVSGYKIR